MKTRLTAAVLLVSSLSFAQTTRAPSKTEPKTVLVFEEGDAFTGEPDGPMLTEVEIVKKQVFSSLIRVRETFKEKVMQSVNEL